jgi:hypothetical protein
MRSCRCYPRAAPESPHRSPHPALRRAIPIPGESLYLERPTSHPALRRANYSSHSAHEQATRNIASNATPDTASNTIPIQWLLLIEPTPPTANESDRYSSREAPVAPDDPNHLTRTDPLSRERTLGRAASYIRSSEPPPTAAEPEPSPYSPRDNRSRLGYKWHFGTQTTQPKWLISSPWNEV